MPSVKAATETQNRYLASANREIKAGLKDKNFEPAIKSIGRGIDDSAHAFAASVQVMVATFKSDEFKNSVDNVGKSILSLPQQLREAAKRNMPEGGYKQNSGEGSPYGY